MKPMKSMIKAKQLQCTQDKTHPGQTPFIFVFVAGVSYSKVSQDFNGNISSR